MNENTTDTTTRTFASFEELMSALDALGPEELLRTTAPTPRMLAELRSLHREPLEVAERRIDAVFADPTLTREQREIEGLKFYLRAYQFEDDALKAFELWRKRDSTEANRFWLNTDLMSDDELSLLEDEAYDAQLKADDAKGEVDTAENGGASDNAGQLEFQFSEKPAS